MLKTAAKALPAIGQGIGSALSSASSNRAAQKAFAQKQAAIRQAKNDPFFGLDPDSVAGIIPEFNPVTFTPFFEGDPGGESLSADVIQGNLNNFGLSSQLSGKINDFLINEGKDRVSAFDPLALGNLQQLGRNASAALGGQLAYGDANRIVANRGRLTSQLGTAGTQRAQTAYDLGMTRSDLANQVGPNLLTSGINNINSILPPQLLSDPSAFMLTPSQALPIAANDNQFGAEFDVSERDKEFAVDAAPDPAAAMEFDILNNLRGLEIGLAGGGVPQGPSPLAQGAASTLGGINYKEIFG